MSRKSVENATFVFKRGVFALSRLCQENIVSSKLVENGVEVLSKRGNFVSIRVTSANSLFLKLLAQTMNYIIVKNGLTTPTGGLARDIPEDRRLRCRSRAVALFGAPGNQPPPGPSVRTPVVWAAAA